MDIRGTLHQLVDDMLDQDPRRALIAYRLMAHEHLPWLVISVDLLGPVDLSRRSGDRTHRSDYRPHLGKKIPGHPKPFASPTSGSSCRSDSD